MTGSKRSPAVDELLEKLHTEDELSAKRIAERDDVPVQSTATVVKYLRQMDIYRKNQYPDIR